MKFIFNNKEYPSIDGVKKAYYNGQGPVPPGPDYTEPFYIQDLSGSENTITIAPRNSVAPVITPYYSFDKENWVSMGATSLWNKRKVNIPANGKVYFRCKTEAWADVDGDPSYTSIYGNEFSSSGDIKAGGNIMSLLYGEDFTGNETTFPSYGQYISGEYPAPYPLGYIFYGNTHLISVLDLLFPATTLVDNCYYRMLYGCTSLTTAPATLPAATLAYRCHSGMFMNCTSLTTAPVLPTTTLVRGCYSQMFYGCTSLNSIKCLATDISATNCLSNWMYNVPSGGTFYKKAGITWPSGVSGIPSGWTVVEE